MSKKDTLQILSIDLDFFGNRDHFIDKGFNLEIAEKIIRKLVSSKKRVVFSRHHGEILNYIKSKINNKKINIINYDFHDDMQLLPLFNPDLDASWVSEVLRVYPETKYTWIMPSYEACVDNGEGLCHRYYNDNTKILNGEEIKIHNKTEYSKSEIIWKENRNDFNNDFFNEFNSYINESNLIFISISDYYCTNSVIYNFIRGFMNIEEEFTNKSKWVNSFIKELMKIQQLRSYIKYYHGGISLLDGLFTPGTYAKKEDLDYNILGADYYIEIMDCLEPVRVFELVGSIHREINITDKNDYNWDIVLHNFILEIINFPFLERLWSLGFRLVRADDGMILSSTCPILEAMLINEKNSGGEFSYEVYQDMLYTTPCP